MRLLILWTGLVAVGAAQQLQQTPGTGCAADGYTVNSITGEPVPRAQLQFMGPSPSATLSDSSGRWKVSGIFCGRLNIFATKTGYLGPKPDARVGAVSVTSPDSPAHDLRVEMTPQSVVMGKVVDEAGDPLQSVQITVMTSRVLEGKRVFLQSAGDATNDLGDYRVPGLSASKAIVCARAPLDARSQMKDEGAVLSASCYPGPVEGGAASAMVLAAGREAQVNFTLTNQASVKIRGKIAGIPPHGGVILSLLPRNAPRNSVLNRPATTQSDGAFEVRGVPPGAWLLSVDYWEANARLFARVPVDVGGADLEGVVVRLEPGFTLTGRIRVESASGRSLNLQQVNLNLHPTEGAVGALQWDKDHMGVHDS